MEEGETKRKEIKADLFFETSGKEGSNIDEVSAKCIVKAFRETAKLINQRYHENVSFKKSIIDEEEKNGGSRDSIRSKGPTL